MMHRALQAVSDTVAKGGRIFVGTKRQAQDVIADAAKRSAQYYVNSRQARRQLTNWKTILAATGGCASSKRCSVRRAGRYTKKGPSRSRAKDKAEKALGIKEWAAADLLFIIDTNKEDIAIKEARR